MKDTCRLNIILFLLLITSIISINPYRNKFHPKYGNLTNVRAIDSVYYKTNKDDYTKRKVLKITKRDRGE